MKPPSGEVRTGSGACCRGAPEAPWGGGGPSGQPVNPSFLRFGPASSAELTLLALMSPLLPPPQGRVSANQKPGPEAGVRILPRSLTCGWRLHTRTTRRRRVPSRTRTPSPACRREDTEPGRRRRPGRPRGSHSPPAGALINEQDQSNH